MRNYLYRFAKVFSFTFFIDNRLVNAAGSNIIGLGCCGYSGSARNGQDQDRFLRHRP